LGCERWWYHYPVEWPHFGARMDGKSPLEKLRELGLNLPDEFACFPVVLLDEVTMVWAVEEGHDLLAYYSNARGGKHSGQTPVRLSMWCPRPLVIIPSFSALESRKKTSSRVSGIPPRPTSSTDNDAAAAAKCAAFTGSRIS